MNSADRRMAEGVLFTDMYELTMAQLYFRKGLHEKRARFEHFFRHYPDYGSHRAGYCVNAGLGWLLDWMSETRFRDVEIEYLRGQTGQTGRRLFGDDFLGWLASNGGFEGISMAAVPEGRVVHPQEPITVVEGPLAMAQILETALLNQLNYQTLVATKAARIRQSAHEQPLVEFGLRRAQERGANAGMRAALIGGADFSSNVGLSRALGFPAKGTHAHSMVQAFMALGEGELGAFRAYAEVYPDDCLLLVDTVDTLGSGIPNAIRVFEELRRQGHRPAGIRLDSGDLAYLSIQAAKMLDAAGFPDPRILLSNQLDETRHLADPHADPGGSASLGRGSGPADPPPHVRRRHAAHQFRGSARAGRRLQARRGARREAVGARDQTLRGAREDPQSRRKSVWRLYDRRGLATADLLGLPDEDPRQMAQVILQHPSEPSKRRVLTREEIQTAEPLLVKVLEEGRRVGDSPTIEQMRARRKADVDRLDPGVKRFVNPHVYHVSLSERLWNRKQRLIQSARSDGAAV